MTHKSMLCVGGPRGGQRYDILQGTGFIVPVRFSEDNESTQVKYFRYKSEIFHTPQGEVQFWVPEGQTPLETITILLETYENKHSTHTIPPRT